MMSRFSGKRGLAVTGTAVIMLLLSACESSGGYRFAGVGSPGGGGGSGGGGGDGSGGDGGSGGPGGPGGSGGDGGTGGNGGTGGTGGSGSDGLGSVIGQTAPILVTAGNAVLGVADGQGKVVTPVATAIPITQPIAGTITKVLTDTGTALVDVGEGRTLLVDGVKGIAGDVLTIDLGNQSLLASPDGAPGAIAVGVLGDTQKTGTIATAGVLNAGNVATATVNGVANVQVANVTAVTGGAAPNLVNLALSGNQVLGNGNPALIDANVLPNGLPLAGAPGAGGVLAPVAATVSGVVANVPVVGSPGSGGSGGSAVGGVLAPVTNVVNGVTGALPVLGANAGAGAGASANGGATANGGGLVSGLVGGLTRQ